MNPQDEAKKYGAKYTAPIPEDFGALASKYGASYTPPQQQGNQEKKKGFLGTNPSDSLYGKITDNSITRGIQSFFPGKQVGQTIGTLGGYGYEKAKGMLGGKDNSANYNLQAPTLSQNLGDIAQGALTVAAPNVGNGAWWGERIGTNALLGAGLGASGSVAEGDNLKDTVKNTALGYALGGGASALGETGTYLTKNMPNWFTKLALPKLGNQLRGTPQETIDYALNNSKGLTLKSMYNNSKNAINSYEGQINAVLNHPQYANEVGSISQGLDSIHKAFPNAGLDNAKITNILKQVAPENKTLVDKVTKGTANLFEQNILRKELDQATKAAYGDKPNLSFAKQIGKSMADFLRANVKGTAKETEPIFSEYTKEHALNKSLTNALAKKRVAGPLVAGAGGFASGGIKGAATAIAIEEGLRSPTAKILAAKALKGTGKVAIPTSQTVFQATKAPLIKDSISHK